MKQAAGQKRKRGTDAVASTASPGTDPTPAAAAAPQTKPPPRGKQKKTFSESKGTAHLLQLALSIASGKDQAEKGRVEHAKQVRTAVDDAAKKRKLARERKKKGGDPLPSLPSARSSSTAKGKAKAKGKLQDGDEDVEEDEYESDGIEKVAKVDDTVILPKLKSKAQLRADIKQKERDRARKRKQLRKQSQQHTEEPAPEPTAKRRRVAFA
ncbi:hypothetical protein OC846_000782 [Tilletia horrida]|uniref:Uncharacterized protein n=1 Tax=Tilletia horrida TaxID=155126 RepID=A0AAN6GWD0_9BASI|nr:hypothetical protein OC846_000782 [Tilletia horrida]KAK0567828.1 hypothetical protein OC861_002497 [Tilletia horrida]